MTVRDHRPAAISRLRGASKPHLTGAAERLVVAGQRAQARACRAPRGARRSCVRLALHRRRRAAAARVRGFGAAARSSTIALVLSIAFVSRVEFDVGAGFTPPTAARLRPAAVRADPAWAPLVVAGGARARRACDTVSPRPQLRPPGPRRRSATPGSRSPRRSCSPRRCRRPVMGPLARLPPRAREPVRRRHGDRRRARVARARRPAAPAAADDGPRLPRRRPAHADRLPRGCRRAGRAARVPARPAARGRCCASSRASAPHRIDQAIELSAAYRGTAFLLGEVIVADDEYTGEHSYGVIALSLEIADELGLSEDDRRLVEFGALLHDVGKIAVPKSIVNKAGPLDDDEWAVMRQHTIAGQRMLDKVGGSMTDVGQIVRALARALGRQGLPRRDVAGEDVPLPARIVSVADTFHAITTTRPYRRAQSPEAAIKELRALRRYAVRSRGRRRARRACSRGPAPRRRRSSSRARPLPSRRRCGSSRTTRPSSTPRARGAAQEPLLIGAGRLT